MLRTYSTIALSGSWHFMSPYAPRVEYFASSAMILDSHLQRRSPLSFPYLFAIFPKSLAGLGCLVSNPRSLAGRDERLEGCQFWKKGTAFQINPSGCCLHWSFLRTLWIFSLPELRSIQPRRGSRKIITKLSYSEWDQACVSMVTNHIHVRFPGPRSDRSLFSFPFHTLSELKVKSYMG